MPELFVKNVRVPFDLAPEFQVSGTYRPVLLPALLEHFGAETFDRFQGLADDEGASGTDDVVFLHGFFRSLLILADLDWNLRDMATKGAPPVEVTEENLRYVPGELVIELGQLVLEGSQERLGNSPAPSLTSSQGGSGAPAEPVIAITPNAID